MMLKVSIAIWAVTIAAGMALLFAYGVRAGAPANAPSRWPSDSSLALYSKTPTLVMVAHPKCSCTRASIAELSRLMTRLHGQLAAYVLFVRPPGVADKAWEKTGLWESASIISGVTPVSDPGGVEALRLGAATSGQTYLFDPEGELLFAGGITPTRAHEGNSVGRQRIISLVTTGQSQRSTSDVFGCPILESNAAATNLNDTGEYL